MPVTLHQGDCLDILRTLPDNSVHSVVTDPPYGLSFMGKKWDYDVPSVEIWTEALRVLKPGGHLLSFSGTRTYHRMVVAIEDAGFEIRDQIGWLYGSGFPKSKNVSKFIDKALGAKREVVGQIIRGDVEKAKQAGVTMAAANANKNNKSIFGYGVEEITVPATDEAKLWDGWGTGLKPAWEPLCVARKPLSGTVAANVLEHATGAINIDECRVARLGGNDAGGGGSLGSYGIGAKQVGIGKATVAGRWPANVIHDGSDEVMDAFPGNQEADGNTASRFFYCAKASKGDRQGSKHPTVKPVALMRYLVRLVTPKGGVVLDPFAGSGTTGQAAVEEGFHAILIEREAEYCDDIRYRLALFLGQLSA